MAGTPVGGHGFAGKLDAPSARRLGPIAGGVCARNQRVGIAASKPDSDARRQLVLGFTGCERLTHGRFDAVGDCQRRDPVDVLAHDEEFVASEARHRVARPHRHPQPAADLDERVVARRVAVRVVDLLEVVEIDEQHGGRTAVSS